MDTDPGFGRSGCWLGVPVCLPFWESVKGIEWLAGEMGAPGLGWWVGCLSPAALSAQVPGGGHPHTGQARARPGRTQPVPFSAETAWSQGPRPPSSLRVPHSLPLLFTGGDTPQGSGTGGRQPARASQARGPQRGARALPRGQTGRRAPCRAERRRSRGLSTCGSLGVGSQAHRRFPARAGPPACHARLPGG